MNEKITYKILHHTYVKGGKFLNVLEKAKKLRHTLQYNEDLRIMDSGGRLAAIVRLDTVELVLLGKTIQYSFSKWGA